MKKLLCFAAPLFAVAALLGPAAPAQAHTDSCTVQGTLSTSSGLGSPGITNNTVSFTFSATVGVCVSGGTLSASGTFTGACGLGSGSGFTNSGHSFSFVLTGTVALVSGGASGALSITADPTDGSCLNKTATRFFVAGELALTH